MNFVLLAATGGPDLTMFFMLAMFAVAYFFLMRPQQKKQKAQDLFVSEIKKGDNVVTTSGIHGRVMDVEDGIVVLQIDKTKGVNIRIQRSAISKELSDAFYSETEA